MTLLGTEVLRLQFLNEMIDLKHSKETEDMSEGCGWDLAEKMSDQRDWSLV